MSEFLFGLLLLASLWWLESALRTPEPRPVADFLGGILLGLPFLCRTAGLLFVPLGLLLLWQGGERWRCALPGGMLAVLPWLAWSLTAAREWGQDPLKGYYTDYFGWWASSGLPALGRVIHNNGLWMASFAGGPWTESLFAPFGSDDRAGPG